MRATEAIYLRVDAKQAGMAGSDPSPPTLEDREDVLWFLNTYEIPLPDGLTEAKIRDRGAWWRIDEDSFSFRLERHPSPFLSSSLARGGPTPARWHIRTRYRYDLTTGEWEVTELTREFSFDPSLLIDHVFERGATRDIWTDAIERVQAADDPEAAFKAEFTQLADTYREQWGDVPADQREEMIAALNREARRRAGLATSVEDRSD